MISQGQTGTYVSATGSIDLPQRKRGRRGHVATQPRCTTCRLPLSRPDSPHVCLDLSKPEVVVVVKAEQTKKGAPRLRRASLTPQEDREIARLYLDELLTTTQIATRIEQGKNTVLRSLERQGIPRRNRASKPRKDGA